MATLKAECASVRDIVAEQFERLEKVRILEAGCGSNSAFDRWERSVRAATRA